MGMLIGILILTDFSQTPSICDEDFAHGRVTLY